MCKIVTRAATAALLLSLMNGAADCAGHKDSNGVRERFASGHDGQEGEGSSGAGSVRQSSKPLVINTWARPGFVTANGVAWSTLRATGDRLRSVTAGCGACERLQCDGSVGYGNHPDEGGEVTLDALVIDGPGHRMGAVGDLRRVKNAVDVARAVMEHTAHTMLAGESATQFALQMGFKEESLSTNGTKLDYARWRNMRCQPNFRTNVSPDATSSCGPYKPVPVPYAALSERAASEGRSKERSLDESVPPTPGHDTIGVIAMDANGDLAAATSTNGAAHKVPGRIGDSPLPGSGAYVDNEVGAAVGTGDGDIMLRFLPTYQAVESMRQGMDAKSACDVAIGRIARRYPSFNGAVVAVDKAGRHAAACHGIYGQTFFEYVYSDGDGAQRIARYDCI